MTEERLAERIWRKEGAAWTDDPGAQRMIPTALGWLDLPARLEAEVGELETLAAEVRQAGFTHVFLLGMGGSSLCPEVLRQTFGSAAGSPRLTVLDTTHPEAIQRAEEGVDLARTLFLVSSKSGGTIETLSLFRYFYGRLQALTGEQAGAHFIALTDPGTSLERLARERGFRRIVPTPPDVGGRYSALTPFGLLPGALIGLDIRTLGRRAQAMARACQAPREADNPGLQLGLLLGRQALAGRDKVTLLVPPAIASFGLWVEQLLAESTGKDGKGLVPVADEPPGPPPVYGDDRVFVYQPVESAPDPELERAVAALEGAGQPVVRLPLRDPLDLGAEFFRWEFATATAGTVLRINAFDQPNVQESKDRTEAVLAAYQRDGALPSAAAAAPEQLVPFLRQARPGDYLALMAYLPPSAETDAALRAIRTHVRDQLRIATTVGYGPRFLHSTGQLHKGGPASGLFVQLVARPRCDLEIPGQPYTFGTLLQAQALGDLQALTARGRRVLRLDLGDDVAGGLAALERLVAAGLGAG